VTTIILWIMHFIPGLRLRASEEAEIIGIDDAELGEWAYDYVGLDSELNGHHGLGQDIPEGGVMGHGERRGGHADAEDVERNTHHHLAEEPQVQKAESASSADPEKV